MSTSEELIRQAEKSVSGMGDNLDAMGDFVGLILVLLTAPDLDDEYPAFTGLCM